MHLAVRERRRNLPRSKLWGAVLTRSGYLRMVGAIALTMAIALPMLLRAIAPAPGPVAATRASDEACAGCHREIYERYRQTPMAHASGRAAEGFLPANFTHEASGVSYRIFEDAGKVYLAFARNSTDNATPLDGRRELKYFLGSGKRGRTYLFEQDGYWFENYLHAQEMPLTLPVDPGCLRCHASGAMSALPEARNKYAGEPFRQGGITCAACHGDSEAHAASGGKRPMLKIGELEPVRRDSVCVSCHLEGEEAVVHVGRRLEDFRPGDNLFDFASYFVDGQQAPDKSHPKNSQARATSQWEALMVSGCKRGAGDALTCTSCHDPHGSTAAMDAKERAQYYRRRCLACHGSGIERVNGAVGVTIAASHHPENLDCASCHMPRVTSSDIAHEQVTDHRIPRTVSGQHIANAPPSSEATAGPLVAIGPWMVAMAVSDRDLGLAYAMRAAKADRVDSKADGERAMTLLRQAEQLPGADGDHELHAQLGFLEQVSGQREAAEREYSAALAADANDAFAAGNLGLLKAEEHRYAEAIGLWERAFREDPVAKQVGMNLAIVDCALGRRAAALDALTRILTFSPDDRKAHEMERAVRAGSYSCGK
jgi:predicted CXXCH cytochrome family protein